MKSYKAIKNFDCNKVVKSVGNPLSESDVEKIGPKFIEYLLEQDMIQLVSEPKKEVPAENHDHVISKPLSKKGQKPKDK
jgi:hypothetical protein